MIKAQQVGCNLPPRARGTILGELYLCLHAVLWLDDALAQEDSCHFTTMWWGESKTTLLSTRQCVTSEDDVDLNNQDASIVHAVKSPAPLFIKYIHGIFVYFFVLIVQLDCEHLEVSVHILKKNKNDLMQIGTGYVPLSNLSDTTPIAHQYGNYFLVIRADGSRYMVPMMPNSQQCYLACIYNILNRNSHQSRNTMSK